MGDAGFTRFAPCLSAGRRDRGAQLGQAQRPASANRAGWPEDGYPSRCSRTVPAVNNPLGGRACPRGFDRRGLPWRMFSVDAGSLALLTAELPVSNQTRESVEGQLLPGLRLVKSAFPAILPVPGGRRTTPNAPQPRRLPPARIRVRLSSIEAEGVPPGPLAGWAPAPA